MIDLLKKHKYLSIVTLCFLIFDLLVATLAIIPANEDITSPGGLNTVQSVINIENGTQLNGSFHTIYVYSMERVSVLQSLIGKVSSFNDVSKSPESIQLSREQNKLSGTLQKQQSIEASLICAYKKAKEDHSYVNLDYRFEGFIVYMYQINHNIFALEDVITKVNDIDTSDKMKLADEINNLELGDVITYIRNGEEKKYEVDIDFKTNKQMFYCYSKYKINETTAFPKYSISQSTTTGPSGGLMQTLSVYSQIIGTDLTSGHKIAGTGTINVDGQVGIIGGITQKIVTAIHNDVELFLCPGENYQEAKEAYNNIPGHEKMILKRVDTFSEAVNIIKELYGNK